MCNTHLSCTLLYIKWSHCTLYTSSCILYRPHIHTQFRNHSHTAPAPQLHELYNALAFFLNSGYINNSATASPALTLVLYMSTTRIHGKPGVRTAQ